MSERLTISSFNIQSGTHFDKVVDSMRTMQQEGTHIFALQEVWKKRLGEALRRRLPEEWEGSYYTQEKLKGVNYGVALMWQQNEMKVLDVKNIELPYLKNVSYVDRRLTTSPHPPRRGGISGTFQVEGRNIRITNVHLDWQGGMKQRIAQVECLKKSLAALPSVKYEIICGDFNTIGFTSRRKMREKLLGEFPPDFQDVLPDLSSTWNAVDTSPHNVLSRMQKPLQRSGIVLPQRMDYILIRGLKVEDAHIEKLGGSNHFPLTATFRFK